ncbi:Glu-tRNA(Gln) amidotransferase subunit GatD [Methanohalophilus sp.]|uniref:Glu-tRNA(Gln) amidotransferase subunit GatD n=1 Tax=Methanohalophilus sp. TaxID=1966352 RepID=UPI002627DA73|nr:Glu-tRNA(Gln) amidotransferase subunit GatD [Methanohalophilus sp.]
MDYELGDIIRVTRNGNEYEGVVMPSVTDHIVLKMKNGYNVGIELEGAEIAIIERKSDAKPTPHKEKTPINKKLPNITILSTGGTIASKVDYRTGAVTAQFSADDIVKAIPELEDIANIRGRVITNILSENMKSETWVDLAHAVAEEIEKGADGIVIAHGTDTMMYSAAALSFMLRTPVPVVFVGSQRSADRPSSDNVMNAICAATVATSDIAEVCVVMHNSSSDDMCAIHYGTRVRKMHTSRRDAFKSINSEPIGYVDYSDRRISTNLEYTKRGEKKLELINTIQPKCALIKFIPGADPAVLSYYIDTGYKGIVIEGTGLGHVSTNWIPEIERATTAGIPVIVTSQCLNGRICNRVYDTGRDMTKAGAIEAEDMLPEVALVKLMWVLGQTNDMNRIRKLMQNPVSNEIAYCSLK